MFGWSYPDGQTATVDELRYRVSENLIDEVARECMQEQDKNKGQKTVFL